MGKNGKRALLLLTILIVAAFSCVLLFSCNIDDVKEISITPGEVNVRIGEFNYADYKVVATYDSGKTEEIELKEDMIAPRDRLKFFLEGEYDIEVTYLDKTTTLAVTVRRNVFAGVLFEDLDVVYNGEFYTVEVKNVPEGTSVTYPSTNRFRSAGSYQATAVLRKDAYEMIELTANVVIRKADYDLSAVSFEDKTETFDGAQHVLALEGDLPVGLFVDYTITRDGGREEKGNAAQNAGVYEVEATFTGDFNNYNVVEPMQATLTISKKEIDVSGIVFANKEVEFDRTLHKVEIEGTLPNGVSVVYMNNEYVDAGTYVATAIFSVDDTVNYASIPEKTAKLTIRKAEYDMSDVHFNGIKVVYDGTEKKIEVQGQIPNGITVSYSGNVGTDAGSYQATAIFKSNNVNYNNPASMTATMIIDPAPAPMDQITFERRRFISQKSVKNDFAFSEEEWAEILQIPEDNPYLYSVYYYDPYLAAKDYTPQNVPTGLKIASVKYKETAGWVDDLSAYDGIGDGYVDADGLDHDGYYVVVVNFAAGNNYTGVSAVKTLIRVDTIDGLSSLKDMVYAADWVNPETKEVTGAFMKAYIGTCVPSDEFESVSFGNVTVQYCDCNIFKDYVNGGVAALKNDREAYMRSEVVASFRALAEDYASFLSKYGEYLDPKTMSIVVGFNEEKDENDDYPTFLDILKDARDTLGMQYADESETWDESFGKNKAAYVSLTPGDDLILTKYDGGKTAADYYALLAQFFGFEDAAEFHGDSKLTAELLGAYCNDEVRASLGVSVDSVDGKLACKGGIYQECEGGYVYVFPYAIWWLDGEYDSHYEYVYVICSMVNGDRHYGALLSNAEALFGFLDDVEAFLANVGDDYDQSAIMVEGRCMHWDVALYHLSPITKVVDVDGVNVERAITSGKDFVFIEDNEATENLIHEDRDVYKFLTELPGNCAEQRSGYDENEYRLETAQAIYTFCECDPFATVIKDGGDASNITKKTDKEDHAEMEEAVAEKFDQLASLYRAFISNYVSGEDVVNEWKISASNKNYGAYRSFFEYASDMISKSNRNMGKDNEFVLSKSVIVGMNRSFTISVSGSGSDYTLDQYRLIVAKLFGFSDLDTFAIYTDSLAQALVQNAKNASVDSMSARLRYDGAVMTEDGYYVLPFAIKSEASTRKVLAFVFVDGEGVMSIWINDARNAYNAMNFGTDELESLDKYTVTIYGRCMMFEDDGYVMKEDLNKVVVDMIDSLQNFANNKFLDDYQPDTCGESNHYWENDPDDSYDESEETVDSDFEAYYRDENPYRIWIENVAYFYCDCDPLTYRIWSQGDADELAKRIARGDYADMEQSVVDSFDLLSEYYSAFFSHYAAQTAEDMDEQIVVDKEFYLDYRRFFRYARDMFASSRNGAEKVEGYLLSDSVIVGLNKAFAISSEGSDLTVADYRLLVAKLLGFTNVDALARYAEDLSAALLANEGNASVLSIADRLVYDGAVLTTNGGYVFPYMIENHKTDLNVLAYLFVDANGTMSIWINDLSAALELIDFDSLTFIGDSRAVLFINGRCALFEKGNYSGHVTERKTQYIAVEKIKTFQSAGDFLIYSPFTDEEGFDVYWFSMYGFENEVIYEDPDSDAIGTVQKGFYTLISVASDGDVRVANQRMINESEMEEVW